MIDQASTRSPLSALLGGLGRVVRIVIGLALLAGTAVLGVLLIGGLLVRSLWRGSRGPATRVRMSGMPAGPAFRRPAARRQTGEVVDIEAREIGPTVR